MMPGKTSLSVCLTLGVILASPAANAQDADQEAFVAIRAGRIITLAGKEYLQGEIVLADGEVRLVGKGLDYPSSAEKIDARREVVMPGMIHPHSRWQLPGYKRAGLHGDREAAREVFPGLIDWQPLLQAGFTAVAFYPDGTGVTGPSAVYRTAGPDEIRELGSAYVRITMSSPSRDKKVLRDAIEKARKEIEKVEKARQEWEEKQKKAQEEAAKKKEPAKEEDKEEGDDKPQAVPAAEGDDGEQGDQENKEAAKKKPEDEKFTPPKIDPAVMPFVRWIRDKQGPPLLFELSGAADLLHLDDALAKSPEIPATLLYLAGGSSPDYHHVMQQLSERDPTVLVQPRIGNLPYTVTRYNLPAELAWNGCSPVLLPAGDTASELGNFRERLADLVRAGLPREDALQAVTLRAAEALGMADRLGSIEQGKCGDLIFLDGDPLDPQTRVTRVMINGQIVWKASE